MRESRSYGVVRGGAHGRPYRVRAAAIACGYEDGNDLDRLLHDPLMKVAVGWSSRDPRQSP